MSQVEIEAVGNRLTSGKDGEKNKKKLRVLAELGGGKWGEVSSDGFFLPLLPNHRSPAKGESWKLEERTMFEGTIVENFKDN